MGRTQWQEEGVSKGKGSVSKILASGSKILQKPSSVQEFCHFSWALIPEVPTLRTHWLCEATPTHSSHHLQGSNAKTATVTALGYWEVLAMRSPLNGQGRVHLNSEITLLVGTWEIGVSPVGSGVQESRPEKCERNTRLGLGLAIPWV